MSRWKCEACGYEFSSDSEPESCPGCGAPISKITIQED